MLFRSAAQGELVFFLVDFGFSPFPFELSNFVPGSTGVACLGNFQTLGFSLANGTGTDTYLLDLSSPFARTIVSNLTLVFQGVSYNPVTGVLEQPIDGVLTVGNPNLKPTDTETWLIGSEYSPSFLKGFTCGIDYYRIEQDGIPFASAEIGRAHV